MTDTAKDKLFSNCQAEQTPCHPEPVSGSQSKRQTQKFINKFRMALLCLEHI